MVHINVHILSSVTVLKINSFLVCIHNNTCTMYLLIKLVIEEVFKRNVQELN